jgi:hypothetical protein
MDRFSYCEKVLEKLLPNPEYSWDLSDVGFGEVEVRIYYEGRLVSYGVVETTTTKRGISNGIKNLAERAKNYVGD